MKKSIKISIGATVSLTGLVAFLNFLSHGPEIVVRDWSNLQSYNGKFAADLELENRGERTGVENMIQYYGIWRDESNALLGCKRIREISAITTERTAVYKSDGFTWSPEDYEPKYIGLEVFYRDFGLPTKLLRWFFERKFVIFYQFNSFKNGGLEYVSDPTELMELSIFANNAEECLKDL